MVTSAGPARTLDALDLGAAVAGYAIARSRVELEAELEPDIEGARPVRLTPLGLWLSVPEPSRAREGESVQVSLRAGEDRAGPFYGHLGPALTQTDGTSVLYVPFAPGPRERTLDAAQFIWSLVARGVLESPGGAPLAVEQVRRPDRIEGIVRGLKGRQARVIGAGEPRAHLPPLELAEGDDLPLRWRAPRPWPEPPFTVELGGLVSAYSFEVRHAELRDGLLAAALPAEIVRRRNRVYRRLAAPAGWFASFPHPLWPEQTVRCRLHDLSIGGFALASDGHGRSGLFPGLLIPHLRVERPGSAPLSFSGRIAHHDADGWSGAELHGVALAPISAEDHVGWMDALARAGRRRTHRGTGWEHELWVLYQKAGYFDISSAHLDFEAEREAFDLAHARVASRPDIGVQVVWPTSRGIEASLSMLRVYSGTWLAYQLARQRLGAPSTPGGAVLREAITDGLEHAYRDPDFRWYLIWIPEHAAFTRRVVLDFSRRHATDVDRVSHQRFRAWMISCDQRSTAVGPYTVGYASASELEHLLATIQRVRPRPYVEAHDFVADRFDLGAVRRAWLPAGLRRERAVLVARRGRTAVAAAVLEMADEGVHLFDLLSTVRIFALDERGLQAQPALIEAARAWYRSRGLHRFVYFAEDDLSPPAVAGAVDSGEADLVVISSDLVPDQLDHTWEVTQPRETHRRAGERSP